MTEKRKKNEYVTGERCPGQVTNVQTLVALYWFPLKDIPKSHRLLKDIVSYTTPHFT